MASGRNGKLHELFIISIIIKGIDGLLETIGGILMFFLDKKELGDIIIYLTQHELFGFNHNYVAQKAWQLLDRQTVRLQMFQAVYLLAHGIIKLVLAWGLLKNKLWGYYTGMILLTGFIAYSLYRWTHTHSIFLIIFTILDITILVLVFREFRLLHKKTKLIPNRYQNDL